MRSIRSQWGNYFGIEVDSRGRSEGLTLMWDKAMEVTLLSYSMHHIDVVVRWSPQEQEWCFTGIYG